MNAIKIVVLVELLALISMIILSALHKFDLAPFKIAFGGFAVSILVLILGALVCFVSLVVFSFYSQHETSWILKLLGVAAGAVPIVLIVLVVGKDGFSKPRIHDISTDPDLKLGFDVIPGLRKSSDNTLTLPSDEIISKQRLGYPWIKPILFSKPAEHVFKEAVAVAIDLGWQIVTSSEVELRFEAIDETTFFGFKDDVLVVVSQHQVDSEYESTVVNIRSVSRVGVSDLGANADRIHRFSKRLESSMSKN